ncbi:hypothetical protein E2C01_038477 [Portunus trituberculatus]|uniref:Uncharacterized protein n=1 Tax=Portunus trituberculatus TaxID=210409 RepID=A0A5B7FGX7_PORTR|nr:hypothetical protein [Portunus trituberculatus]
MATSREPRDIKRLMQEQMKNKAITRQIDSPHAKRSPPVVMGGVKDMAPTCPGSPLGLDHDSNKEMSTEHHLCPPLSGSTLSALTLSLWQQGPWLDSLQSPLGFLTITGVMIGKRNPMLDPTEDSVLIFHSMMAYITECFSKVLGYVEKALHTVLSGEIRTAYHQPH